MSPSPAYALRVALALSCILLYSSGYTKGTVDHFHLQVGGGNIDVKIEPGQTTLTHDQIRDWVDWSAKSIVAYYHRYPVRQLTVEIGLYDGDGVGGGHTFGQDDGSGLIRIDVGNRATLSDLRDDWMMTHEMVHLTFPSVPGPHHWIEEGIATYVEPIARIRAGYLTESQVWGDVVRDMWQGLPEPGDRGLDHTHTWGRTYWGGAMFCLLADIEIHKRTKNTKGLGAALRAILNAGGNINEEWNIDRTLKIGDQATGVPVLQELYAKMKDQPDNVDLDEIWRSLGIERKNGVTTFARNAPLADIRQAISFGKPPTS